jgi:hypothetical protein
MVADLIDIIAVSVDFQILKTKRCGKQLPQAVDIIMTISCRLERIINQVNLKETVSNQG